MALQKRSWIAKSEGFEEKFIVVGGDGEFI
jgi:hypothetical protein